MSCEKCFRGHIRIDDGSWIRCSCLIKETQLEQSYLAGVPRGTEIISLPLIPKTLPGLSDLRKEILAEIDPPTLNGKEILVHGDNYAALSYAILLWFISFGIKCKVAHIETVADLFIGKKRDEYKEVRESPFLLLFFGREFVSDVHKNLLQFIIEFRMVRGFFTVLAFEKRLQDVSRIYGKNLYSTVVDPSKLKVIDSKPLDQYLKSKGA